MKSCYSLYTQPEERRITNALLDAIFLDPERTVTVYNGVEEGGPFCNKAHVKTHLAATGSDWVYLYDAHAKCVGGVWLVWGNGEDLISDWSDNPVINEICEKVLDYINL